MIDKKPEKPVILIVDDSVENLQVLSFLLGDLYSIKIAKSGEKAVEISAQLPSPDLILMDVVMPGINGFEACRLIKENPVTQKIPVIFLTALNEVTDETMGFKIGGADFITKPFNPEIVLARIRTHLDLQAERRKTETLLNILLPEKVVSELINSGSYKPEVHDEVSILFCDFVGFTGITAALSPELLIDELSNLFSEFDEICKRNGVMRIKTIGDAYMAVCGIEREDEDHADKAVKCGLDFIRFLHIRNGEDQLPWICRVGVHSGSVIGGIVGKTRFAYDIMGDSVNIAARVESSGLPMRVAVTEETRKRLKQSYSMEAMGEVSLKGKGEMSLFLIDPFQS
jgi:adenylate cyclase